MLGSQCSVMTAGRDFKLSGLSSILVKIVVFFGYRYGWNEWDLHTWALQALASSQSVAIVLSVLANLLDLFCTSLSLVRHIMCAHLSSTTQSSSFIFETFVIHANIISQALTRFPAEWRWGLHQYLSRWGQHGILKHSFISCVVGKWFVLVHCLESLGILYTPSNSYDRR